MSLSLFDLAPGKTLLDRYRIRRPHRHGGMSTTFEVEELAGGKALEMQVFPAALFESPAQAREFADDLARWKTLGATSVLGARDVHALDDGTVLHLTDMPPGRSLRVWLQENGHAAPSDTVSIGLQLLDELAAVHGAALVHGDIKPQTIHVEKRKGLRVTLVDGGITPALWKAKHLGDKTALIGTPYYAPVEQFGGESPDVLSDLYNVATVLYEIVTGVLPWEGKSFLEVFQAKLRSGPPSMKRRANGVEVPAELEQVIAGGLMAERGERYASAAAFRERLAAVEAGLARPA